MAPSDANNEEGSGIQMKKQDHLMKQDATAIDPTKLTALTPEVVSLYPFLFPFVSNVLIRWFKVFGNFKLCTGIT